MDVEFPELVAETPYVWRASKGGTHRHRLICFPHAGAGAGAYAEWAGLVPPDIELAAVQLPGRQNRIAEDPVTAVGPLVRVLTQALRPVLDGLLVLRALGRGGARLRAGPRAAGPWRAAAEPPLPVRAARPGQRRTGAGAAPPDRRGAHRRGGAAGRHRTGDRRGRGRDGVPAAHPAGRLRPVGAPRDRARPPPGEPDHGARRDRRPAGAAGHPGRLARADRRRVRHPALPGRPLLLPRPHGRADRPHRPGRPRARDGGSGS
ncbi:hypothetical protein SGRIM128S_08722 [Streptomyces griseomycini]